jgi:membrane protein
LKAEQDFQMKNKTIPLIKETFSHWLDKDASRMGAAISYYAIFSIAPLLILLMGVVRTIFDKTTTTNAIARILNVTIGSHLSSSIQTLINSSYPAHNTIVTTTIGVVVLIVAALSVLAELNNDLDELWRVPSLVQNKSTTAQTVTNFIKERFISLLLILLLGVLFLFLVAFSVFLSFFHYTLPLVLQGGLMIQVLNIIVSLLGGTLLFALIYRILPDTKLPWRELIWGALATAVLFLIGRYLISWYIDAFGDTTAYGAAGSVIGLLLWIYYSAQVFFIGAAGTFVYSKNYGFLSRKIDNLK